MRKLVQRERVRVTAEMCERRLKLLIWCIDNVLMSNYMAAETESWLISWGILTGHLCEVWTLIYWHFTAGEARRWMLIHWLVEHGGGNGCSYTVEAWRQLCVCCSQLRCHANALPLCHPSYLLIRSYSYLWFQLTGAKPYIWRIHTPHPTRACTWEM